MKVNNLLAIATSPINATYSENINAINPLIPSIVSHKNNLKEIKIVKCI